MELSEIRTRLDELDGRLIELLAERFELSRIVGEYKAANGLPVLDEARESAVLSHAAQSGDAVKAVYAAILAESRKVQYAMNKTNVVLAGMPGCGKTAVGRALADMMGRHFIDTDGEFEKFVGWPPNTFLNLYGEAEFRREEQKVVAEVGKYYNVVIATGGGVPLAEANREALRANGRIVLLKRPLHKLATVARPLSTDLEALYKKRLPAYEDFCDVEIENDGDVRDVAAKILKWFEA